MVGDGAKCQARWSEGGTGISSSAPAQSAREAAANAAATVRRLMTASANVGYRLSAKHCTTHWVAADVSRTDRSTGEPTLLRVANSWLTVIGSTHASATNNATS